MKVALIITNREFARSGGNPPRMELGKTWGPFTFEFLITDVEIGLGPGEAIDASLMITVDVVEYWYPPIGNHMAYPITFSNKQQTPTKLVNPAEEPTLSFRRRHGMRPVEEAHVSGHGQSIKLLLALGQAPPIFGSVHRIAARKLLPLGIGRNCGALSRNSLH